MLSSLLQGGDFVLRAKKKKKTLQGTAFSAANEGKGRRGREALFALLSKTDTGTKKKKEGAIGGAGVAPPKRTGGRRQKKSYRGAFHEEKRSRRPWLWQTGKRGGGGKKDV